MTIPTPPARRQQLLDAFAGARADRRTQMAALRSTAVLDAWDAMDPERPVWVSGLPLHGLQPVMEGDTVIGVEILLSPLADDPDPHYRIINPPMLVPDPVGDVVVRGGRFREDPLAAVAAAILGVREGRGRK